jgi:glycosyltransferase involved in cell wall biosynthesis
MSGRMLNVAMVAGMPYPMAKASAIRVNHLVRNLVEEFEDVRVQVFAYRGETEIEPHPRIGLHLVGGFDAEKSRYYSWSNKIPADLKLIGELIRARHSIDVIHCHTVEGLGIALAFKALTLSSVPVCVDVHGPIVEELVHYRMMPRWRPVVAAATGLESLMLRRTRHAFVSNEGLWTMFAPRLGADRVTVVWDYVDLKSFDRGRIDGARVSDLARRLKPAGEKLILFLGMFKDYQGGDYLIRAFAGLSGRHPQARLVLVGDGPCRAQYESLIASLGLGERVVLPGRVPHADIPHWLDVADVLVSPRIDNEITRAGFVSQMPEYMAAGKVIVSTWVSGCRRLLEGGAGILVEPNDVESLRAGLERALTMQEPEAATFVSRARDNVANFTWQKGIRAVSDTYRRLLPARALQT